MNKKTQTPDDGLSGLIFAVVIAFAMSEISMGALRQAKEHLGGLERMLEVKGGFSSLDRNRFLQQKTLRQAELIRKCPGAANKQSRPILTTIYELAQHRDSLLAPSTNRLS